MDRSISSTVPTSTRDLGWWSFRGIIRCWMTLRSVRFFFQLYKLYTVNVHSCSYICTWDTLPSSCLLFHSTCSNAAPAAPVLWTLVALWASWLVSLIWFWSKHQGAQAATLKWILKSFSTFTSAEECACLAAQLLHVEHTNGWGAKRATHGTQLAATNLDVVVAPLSYKWWDSPPFTGYFFVGFSMVFQRLSGKSHGFTHCWPQDVCDLIGHRQKAPNRSRLCQHGVMACHGTAVDGWGSGWLWAQTWEQVLVAFKVLLWMWGEIFGVPGCRDLPWFARIYQVKWENAGGAILLSTVTEGNPW